MCCVKKSRSTSRNDPKRKKLDINIKKRRAKSVRSTKLTFFWNSAMAMFVIARNTDRKLYSIENENRTVANVDGFITIECNKTVYMYTIYLLLVNFYWLSMSQVVGTSQIPIKFAIWIISFVVPEIEYIENVLRCVLNVNRNNRLTHSIEHYEMCAISVDQLHQFKQHLLALFCRLFF